jgi:hypothetical protein
MIKPVSLIAPAAGIVLLLLGGALWLQAECPGRLAAGMPTLPGAPAFKPYHPGENPWAGAWQPGDTALAAPNAPNLGHHPRVAGHSASPHSCERDSETAKPGLSS